MCCQALFTTSAVTVSKRLESPKFPGGKCEGDEVLLLDTLKPASPGYILCNALQYGPWLRMLAYEDE